MTHQHWLIKFAPFRTSWSEIVARGIFTPRGIRSPEARRYLNSMSIGDQVLFYQSQHEQAIVGLLQVSREAYPDPTSADPHWLTCDFSPLATLKTAVSLKKIKDTRSLANLALIRQPRLAVMPVSKEEFETIQKISND